MHAICAGKLGGDRNRTGATPWGGQFEVYDQGRFFTVTGNGAGAITERQAQLNALVLRMFGQPAQNGSRPTAADHDIGPGRSVEELVAAHPKLGQIARRQGKAPKDSTPSGWDFWLVCESVRCAELRFFRQRPQIRMRVGCLAVAPLDRLPRQRAKAGAHQRVARVGFGSEIAFNSTRSSQAPRSNCVGFGRLPSTPLGAGVSQRRPWSVA